MYAGYGWYKPNYSLSSDDIQGIQKLYGKHPEKPVCANKGIFCEDYKRRVGCEWNKEYMYTNCPKACGLCKHSVGANCSRDADCKYNLYCSRDPQTINTCKQMIRTNMTYNSYAMPVGQCRSGEAIDKCTGGGNRWGYLFSWDCRPGRPIGVEVVCNDQHGK